MSCVPSPASTPRWPSTCSSQEPAQHFLDDVVRLLEWQIPAFALEGKSYLSIAIGCTGGRHRSVAMAEEIRRRLRPRKRRLSPRHRSMKVVAVGGGHGTAVSLARPQADLRATSPASSRWPTTAARPVDCARCSTWPRWATCESASVALADPENPLTASFEHRFSVGRARRARRRESSCWSGLHRRDGQPRGVRARRWPR